MPRANPEELETIKPQENKTFETGFDKYKYDESAVVLTDNKSNTKRVKLDLEVDASTKDIGPNPYYKWIHLARAVDSWRIFPRIFITVYIVLLYKSAIWYMELTNPTMEQSGLISVIIGAGAAWFGLYLGSGKKQ